MAKKRSLAPKIVDWYRRHKRSTPWRDHPDPYAVWVSEIMLQQTRVETVGDYFERWMAAFPTVKKLAAADQQDVLRLWEGLGYYSRARNLHKAARMLVADFDGRLPADVDALRSLPGIGRYTAGAIASMAFGMDAALVDGNVKRLLSRVFNVEEAVDSSAGEKRIWALTEQHLPSGEAAAYNQGLMELGSRVCQPRNPKCTACPLASICEARKLGIQAERPVMKPRRATPHHIVGAAVIQQAACVLLAQRPAEGLLGGMWEFPGGKQEQGESLPACVGREIKEELAVRVRVGKKLGVYEHAYSHFRVTLHAYLCEIANGTPKAIEAQAIEWVSLEDLDTYPMGKLDRMIAESLLNSIL